MTYLSLNTLGGPDEYGVYPEERVIITSLQDRYKTFAHMI